MNQNKAEDLISNIVLQNSIDIISPMLEFLKYIEKLKQFLETKTRLFPSKKTPEVEELLQLIEHVQIAIINTSSYDSCSQEHGNSVKALKEYITKNLLPILSEHKKATLLTLINNYIKGHNDLSERLKQVKIDGLDSVITNFQLWDF